MLTYPNVLLLTSDAGEAAELQRLLSRYVVLTCAGTLGELLELLENGRYDALFCAWSFDLGTWKEALQEVQKRYPGIPVIVLSPCGAEHEWLEVLDAGAFDLLAMPYQERKLLAVIEQAGASGQARTWHDAGLLLKKIAGAG